MVTHILLLQQMLAPNIGIQNRLQGRSVVTTNLFEAVNVNSLASKGNVRWWPTVHSLLARREESKYA